MKKENKEPENSGTVNEQNSPSEIAKINAIRDIIFGHDMAEYNEQFNSLRNLIADNAQSIVDNKEDILQRLEALQDQFNESLKNLENNLNQQIEQIKFEKTDRQMLGTLLEEIGKKIKA